MAQPGEVWAFYSPDGDKQKYHLCVSVGGRFLYLNSPKAKSYPGDFEIESADVPFLPITASGKTIISCTLLIAKSDADLGRERARCLGSVSVAILRALAGFIEATPVLTEAQREAALEGLYDWGIF